MKLPKIPLVVIAAILLIAIIASVGAIMYYTAPEHVSGTPIDHTPTPTPSPTASPTPTATPVELHLSSNNTTPFFKGDTVHLIASFTPPIDNATIILYNNGNDVAHAQTNSEGIAYFDRAPSLPYDYSITGTVP